jgi:alkylated DNA nucleotide flippase Atl1
MSNVSRDSSFVSWHRVGSEHGRYGRCIAYETERSLAELLVEPVESTKVPPSSGSISIPRS